MGLNRVYSKIGSILINRFNQAAGPNDKRVDAELDNIIAAFNTSFGVYFADVSIIATDANTNEKDFSSKTVLANTLKSDGDLLLFFSRVVYAANANTKQYRVYWDGNVVFDTTAQAFNGVAQFLIGVIFRETGATLSTVFANIVGNAINPAVSTTFVNPTSFSVNKILKTTGQNGAASAGDITQAGVFLLRGSV